MDRAQAAINALMRGKQADAARRDCPTGLRLDQATLAAAASCTSDASPVRGYQPPKRAGPGRVLTLGEGAAPDPGGNLTTGPGVPMNRVRLRTACDTPPSERSNTVAQPGRPHDSRDQWLRPR
jgi:hypothetical protein